MATLTHWKKLENPDYIGAYAFQPGEKKTLTIKSWTRELVKGPDGKEEQHTIVHFAENEKPLIVNRTNGKMITKVTGTAYVEQWPGKRIVLGVEKVKAFGEVVEAVRVKKDIPPQPTAQPAPIPSCTDCGGEIKAVGEVVPEKIVAAGMKRYGVPLCMDCATRRAQEMKKREEAEHADNQNQDQ